MKAPMLFHLRSKNFIVLQETNEVKILIPPGALIKFSPRRKNFSFSSLGMYKANTSVNES